MNKENAKSKAKTSQQSTLCVGKEKRVDDGSNQRGRRSNDKRRAQTLHVRRLEAERCQKDRELVGAFEEVRFGWQESRPAQTDFEPGDAQNTGLKFGRALFGDSSSPVESVHEDVVSAGVAVDTGNAEKVRHGAWLDQVRGEWSASRRLSGRRGARLRRRNARHASQLSRHGRCRLLKRLVRFDY